MKYVGKFLFYIQFLVMGFATFSCANDIKIQKGIEKIMSHIDVTAMPGCNVGVIQNGVLIHKAGYGLANLELGVPLDGTQVHRMASVSKQFTGMAVLLLADEGKINLSDDIRQHLPELRDYGHKVTINSMLGHFSGLSDYDVLEKGTRVRFLGEIVYDEDRKIPLKPTSTRNIKFGNTDYMTREELYELVQQIDLSEKPNTKTIYSNVAYYLLSVLVERVSGESLRVYADKKIFKPLGMSDTFFADDPVEIIRNRANGYRLTDEGSYVVDMTNLYWVGDGGVFSTIDDMAIWDQHFYKPKLGKEPKKLMQRYNSPNSKLDWEGGFYANGQAIGNKFGVETFMHSGGWHGTSTYYHRFPAKKLSVIVLCNRVHEPSWNHANDIAYMIIRNKYSEFIN